MKKQLQKAISLVAKTGEKIIVVDEKTDTGIVVMSLNEYETILNGKNNKKSSVCDLTEEQLLDKINRDIAMWKDKNNSKNLEEFDDSCFEEDYDDEDDYEDDYDEDDDMYYYEEPEEPFEIKYNEDTGEKEVVEKEKKWNIPSEVKNRADI